jgi:LSD1 subclass zinc finger protein
MRVGSCRVFRLPSGASEFRCAKPEQEQSIPDGELNKIRYEPRFNYERPAKI